MRERAAAQGGQPCVRTVDLCEVSLDPSAARRRQGVRLDATKLAALGVVPAVFALVPFVVEALTSYIIAVRGNAAAAWRGAPKARGNQCA